MNRREYLKSISIASLSFCLHSFLTACDFKNKTILLVSGWQDVNMGDIGHTPGLLHILKVHLIEKSV